jgi:RNA polymerase sigma factor (sigma-70 family)
MNDAPTIYIVDDDPDVRKGLIRLIKSVRMACLAFDSAQAFLEHPHGDGSGCVVLDVRMPGLSGLDLQERMRARGLDIPIIFITGHASVSVSVRAMKGGAVNFIEKPFDEETLLDAIREAVKKSRRENVRRSEARDAQQRLARLTPRERDVFALVAAGRLNKQVADELGLSEKTVKVHRGRLVRKLGAQSVADLVRLAGLTRPSSD